MSTNYPSKYEVQAIFDAMDAIDSVYTGGCENAKITHILRVVREEIRQEFLRVTDGYQSPWTFSTDRKGKRKVEWDISAPFTKALKEGES